MAQGECLSFVLGKEDGALCFPADSFIAVKSTDFGCAAQGVREIEEWMCRSSGIPLEKLRQHLFLFRDRDATSHLLRHVLLSRSMGLVVLRTGVILYVS